MASLPANGVLVQWGTIALIPTPTAGEPIKVDRQPGRILYQRQVQCIGLRTDEEIQVFISSPASANWLQLIACLNGPGLRAEESSVRQMVASTRIYERSSDAETYGTASRISKNTRFWWLRRATNLTSEQRRGLAEYRWRYRTMARAYQLKLEFDEFWEQPADDAEAYLHDWCMRVYRSRLPLEPLKTFADTVVDNWERLLHWFESRIGNGILEAINSLVQAAKRRARGYRNTRHYIAMIS